MLVNAEGKITKVGNSSALILPKIVFDNYKVKQGDMMKIVMTEIGLFIPAKQTDSSLIQKEVKKALKSIVGKRGNP